MSSTTITDNLPDWVNAGFILTLVGMVGGGISYLLMFCLKSRCTNIECCCMKCVRTPIPVAELNGIQIRNSGRAEA
jgi:hypothetical protein